MLSGNPPPPTSLFFLFLSISFPSHFKKKSENFGGGLNPLNPPPLKYALVRPTWVINHVLKITSVDSNK